ncbi:MAG TPA: hypothetical protein VGI17_16250 [Solirubrobacterales bacterium]
MIADAEGKMLYNSHRDNPTLHQFNRSPIPVVQPGLHGDLATSAPKAIRGAEADLVGTITRKAGSRQVTYGHRLYEFRGNAQPGETTATIYSALGLSGTLSDRM